MNDEYTMKLVQEEERNWSLVFTEEKYKEFRKFSSYWWQDYYASMFRHFNSYISKNTYILEAGAGSGKASFLLAPKNRKVLLDISPSALEYAKFLAQKLNTKNNTFMRGNIFELPFPDKTFDFVWNVGVVEHYDIQHISSMMQDMIRVTKDNGVVAIGYPNSYSGPILKAKLLSLPPFKSINGYRLNSEKFYSRQKLLTIINNIPGGRIGSVKFATIGNPLPIETPKWALNTFGRVLDFLLPKNRFLTFVIIHMREN
jgi:ubiquinone/menaquinone biosynthesis C-methylase UbiE